LEENALKRKFLFGCLWVTHKVTIKEAENEYLIDLKPLIDCRKSMGMPSGVDIEKWGESIKNIMIEGDELWAYNTPRKYWKYLGGRKGYLIVRDGKVIKDFLVMMS
jgi:hypothetical protein